MSRRNKKSPTLSTMATAEPEETDAVEAEESYTLDESYEDDEQETEQAVTPTSSDDLPPAATQPASAHAPESTPSAAGKTPATSTGATQKRKYPIDFGARAEPCPPRLAKMNEEQSFAGHSKEYEEHMRCEVPCQIIEPLKGGLGVHFTFNFVKAQILMLPRWFALQFQHAIVIKE